jgi:hypothetical protein
MGEDVSSLQPLELTGAQGAAAWPPANPVLTPAALPRKTHDAIAHPHLWAGADGRLLLFFEAAACGSPGAAVMVAESRDGGVAWAVLGAARSGGAPGALRRPQVLQYAGETFMVTDGAVGPSLHRAAEGFPLAWRFNRTLVAAPLEGATVVRFAAGRWLLVGSLPAAHGGWRRRWGGQGAPQQRHSLAVFAAPSALGPWAPCRGSPFGVGAASPGGGVFTHSGGALARFGRECTQKACGAAAAVSFDLTAAGLRQRPLELMLGARRGRQREAWDSAGLQHVTVATLRSGRVVAVAVGRSLGYRPPAAAALLAALRWALAAVAAAAAALLAAQAAAWLRERRGAASNPGRGRRAAEPPSAHWRAAVSQQQQQQQRRLSRWWVAPRNPSWRRAAAAAAVAWLAAGGAVAAHAARGVLRPYWRPAGRVSIDGQHSQFTLMAMSYEARLRGLRWWVHHYSQCPSVGAPTLPALCGKAHHLCAVPRSAHPRPASPPRCPPPPPLPTHALRAGEILIVWNQGAPPQPSRDFPAAAVPVRVRVEPRNSMNNRFRPDPGIKRRAVLSLDDDILVPCADVEAAFATWRRHPARLVGFYPRLAEPDAPGGPLRYHGEPAAAARGRYNLVLAGAAFMDADAFFPAYWAPALAPARALVDELRNCDDLLMNFVAGNASRAAGGGGVRYVRPSRRVDVSGLSGVGISHDEARFVAGADACLAAFPALFGGRAVLRKERFDWSVWAPPRCGGSGVLDCSYLS